MDKLNRHINLFKAFLLMLFYCISGLINAQLYIGDGVSIKEGTTVSTKENVVINTDKIDGKGQIVLNGNKRQKVDIKKENTQLAKIVVDNEKGVEVNGYAEALTTENVYIVKGNVIHHNEESNVAIAQKEEKLSSTKIVIEDNPYIPVVYRKDKFVAKVLGYGTIIEVKQNMQNDATSTTQSIDMGGFVAVVLYSDDFIQLPLNNYYYTKSSNFYYTHTYEEDDYSQIFHPPKIA